MAYIGNLRTGLTIHVSILFVASSIPCPGESAVRFFPTSDDISKDGLISSTLASSGAGEPFWELVSSSSDSIPLQNRTWSSSDVQMPSHIILQTRLQKLEHHFKTLRVFDENCRQRLLCNLAENPKKFSPLVNALLDETRFVGDEKVLASLLVTSKDGARLLSYIEAAQKGASRIGCDTWTYRCPQTVTQMIDYKSLQIWKELSKWLTVKFVAKKAS